MGKSKRNKNWRKERRIGYLEKKEYQYYIFCEGEKTEPNYFSGFKKIIEQNPIYKDMVEIQIEPCGAETLRVVNAAESYVKKNRIKNAQIWCVYDKDSFPASDFNAAAEKVKRLSENSEGVEYYAAWSNECIELWFILHFTYYTSNNDRSMYIEFLDQTFASLKLNKYQKNTVNIFDILLEHGNPKNAILFAKKLIDNQKGKTPSDMAPVTKVHLLVEELVKYLPEAEKQKFM